MTAASEPVEPKDADQNGHSSRLVGQTPSSEAIESLPLDNAERRPSAVRVAKTLICIQNWLNRVERRRSTEGIRYDLDELVKSSSKDSLHSRKDSNASVVLNIGEPTVSGLSSLKKLANQWANKLLYETIDFKETWYKIWLGVVTLTYLYNLVTIIARFSFYELEEQLYSVWLALNYLSDAVYLFDCYVELRLVFYEHGMPVTDRHRVMKSNLKTKPFALSAVASLPTDHILGLLVVQFVNFAETETSMPNLFRTVQLMVIVYLIFHWATCFYFLVSTAYGLESDSWVYNSERILDVTFDCANSTCQQPPEVVGTGTCGVIQYPILLKHYLLCLYWAALVLISVGEQPVPIEIGQYVFTIVNFVAGTLILAGLIGRKTTLYALSFRPRCVISKNSNVRIVVAGMNQQRSTFRSCFDGVKNFMEMRKVNLELRKRVISWFTYVWEQKHAINEDAVMAMLPLNLRTQLAIALHIRTLKKASLFKDCDPGLLTEIALKLKLQIFSPGDYICRKGEIGKDMYIVKKGLLNVVADDGVTVLVTLKEGSVFGELSIMDIPGNRNGNRRTTSVRSVGFSELFALSKSDLFESLEKYPEAKRLLLEKGREILRKDKLLIENEPLPKNVFDLFEQEYDYESLNQLSRNIVNLKRQLAEKNIQVKRTCDLTEQRVLQLEQNCRSNYCTWRESR
ncbi:cyclic nucleotide gated cation channel [Trichuris trichiura]|uniref:Cyclic nucleotide gated cation channel n=1 Tax=Trichuris trichiura TaxID=36087 RepID=A0A077YY14_TRITR|nr:cyclic nucleotide gated cation channel [Trichuris trichiura]